MGLCFPHLRAPQIGLALLSVLSTCFSLGVQLLLSSIGFAAEAFALLPEFLPRSVNTGTEQQQRAVPPELSLRLGELCEKSGSPATSDL